MLQLLEAQAAGQRIGVSAQRIRQLVRARRLSPYAITTRGGVLFREQDLQRFAVRHHECILNSGGRVASAKSPTTVVHGRTRQRVTSPCRT